MTMKTITLHPTTFPFRSLITAPHLAGFFASGYRGIGPERRRNYTDSPKNLPVEKEK